MSNWSDCNGCRYYDSSVDACNCDDKCYIDGAKDFAEWLCAKSAFETIESKGMWGRDIRGKQKYYPIDAVLYEWQNSNDDTRTLPLEVDGMKFEELLKHFESADAIKNIKNLSLPEIQTIRVWLEMIIDCIE